MASVNFASRRFGSDGMAESRAAVQDGGIDGLVHGELGQVRARGAELPIRCPDETAGAADPRLFA